MREDNEANDTEPPDDKQTRRSSHCSDASSVWVDRPEPLRKALDLITDEWVESGQSCQQTTLDLRDSCRHLLRVCDLWQWMIDMRSRIDMDSDISRDDVFVFLDVDDEIVARGTTALGAIENAKAKIEGGV